MSHASTDTSAVYDHKYAEWGVESLQDVSRTFALSLEFLPVPLRSYVSTAYLLCRIPDTIEDTTRLTPAEKSQLLTVFEEVMTGDQPATEFERTVMHTVGEDASTISSYSPDWKLVMETNKAIELYESFDEGIQEAMRPWVIELTSGMRKFVDRYSDTGGVRVQTQEELEEYCYYVAGTVGHLLADTISEFYGVTVSDELHQAAEEYGLVLQFVNIAKDVHDDYETENNVYLPIEQLEEVGVKPETITDSENSAAVGEVVENVVDEAEAYFPKAQFFLKWFRQAVNQDSDFASFALPYLLAVATIRDLRENSDLAVEPEEVKITRDEVMAITASVTGNSLTVEQYEEMIQEGTFRPE